MEKNGRQLKISGDVLEYVRSQKLNLLYLTYSGDFCYTPPVKSLAAYRGCPAAILNYENPRSGSDRVNSVFDSGHIQEHLLKFSAVYNFFFHLLVKNILILLGYMTTKQI